MALELVTEQVEVTGLRRDAVEDITRESQLQMLKRDGLSEDTGYILLELEREGVLVKTLGDMRNLPDRERYSLPYFSIKQGLSLAWASKAYTLSDLFGDDKLNKVIIYQIGREREVVQLLCRWIKNHNKKVKVGMCRSFIARLKGAGLPTEGVFQELLNNSKPI